MKTRSLLLSLTLFSSMMAAAALVSYGALTPIANPAPAGSEATGNATPVSPLIGVPAPIENPPAPATARVGEEIKVWVKDPLLLKPGKANEGKLTLFIDGREMGVEPTVRYDNPRIYHFMLEKTPENSAHWRQLFKAEGKKGYNLEVGFSGRHETAAAAFPITLEEKEQLKNSVEKRSEVQIPMRKLVLENYAGSGFVWFGGILIVATVVLIVVLGASTHMLRENIPLIGADPKGYHAFSLGRVQMMWWFIVILSSYLYVWIVLGERNTLNETALTLLGISVGTAATSRLVDSQTAPREGRIVSDPKKTGFLYDILRDDNGISGQRLQMVVWTLVLSAVYVVALLQTRDLPILDKTLLFLMGISSGLYLGFKFPENARQVEEAKNAGNS